ncbi:hypothetical protein [Saccharibacillus sacchari]|uniref:Uncharacterized protein n=1 Tax=Saccharibacillus sacchari TaxID=456493 RepID=A0ACC6P5W2_9BACL
MGLSDWVSIVAIVFSIVAFMFSWKWSSDSGKALEEVRRVAEKIENGVEVRTKDIERRVEERTKDIERLLDDRTRILEQKVEDRLSDLIKRAAPSAEDKAFGEILTQVGPQLFTAAFSNPEMMKKIMETNEKDK